MRPAAFPASLPACTKLPDALSGTKRKGLSGGKERPDRGRRPLRCHVRHVSSKKGLFRISLGLRRDLNKQDLATVMREFIQEFEHTTGRMYQMLYGETPDNEDDQKIAEVFDWLNFVFRSAIYALLSGWIEDKQDHFAITTTINLTTGETYQERTGTEMTVPKKYRRATKRL